VKNGTDKFIETSVRNCHYTLRDIPEEGRSHLIRGGSLKSHISLYFEIFEFRKPTLRETNFRNTYLRNLCFRELPFKKLVCEKRAESSNGRYDDAGCRHCLSCSRRYCSRVQTVRDRKCNRSCACGVTRTGSSSVRLH
jgi:hypothetical protein